jgi:hypothetical protein
MKVAYHYLFFKLYNIRKRETPSVFADWQAAIKVLVIEVWLILCIIGDVSIVIQKDIIALPYVQTLFLVIIIILAIIKYLLFIRRAQWQHYQAIFQAWPKKKSMIADLLIRGLTFFLITNLALLFYVVSNADWA